MSLVKFMARVLDIDLDEEFDVEPATEEDFEESDIVYDDGSQFHLNYEELTRREEDIFSLDDEKRVRCCKCGDVPHFTWHLKYYCQKCLLRRDVLSWELALVNRNQYKVGILVLKDNRRIPFLWDDDVVYRLRKAKRSKNMLEVEDLNGSSVYVEAQEVLAVKQPTELYYINWEEDDGDF